MSKKSSSRPVSNQPGNGGNWPSTTGNKSGGNRGIAEPSTTQGKK